MTILDAIRSLRAYADGYAGNIRGMCATAADMLEELDKHVPRWISVEDEQKPLHGHDYLCVCTLPNDPEHKFDFISVRWWNATTGNGYVDRPHFSDEGMEGMTVTHWMSLPETPKEAP